MGPVGDFVHRPVGVVVVAGIIRTTTTPTRLISFYLLGQFAIL